MRKTTKSILTAAAVVALTLGAAIPAEAAATSAKLCPSTGRTGTDNTCVLTTGLHTTSGSVRIRFFNNSGGTVALNLYSRDGFECQLISSGTSAEKWCSGIPAGTLKLYMVKYKNQTASMSVFWY